ncbi:MAG TPA: sensor histidine kinase [Mycobacteriales bacterium]|nr:sensor histidine kinase [Mycobacteriales bacterium]
MARPPRPGLSPGGADALAADALSGQPPPLWPAVSGRLRALRKAHPWLVDSLLVAALEVITLIGVVHRGGNVWWIGILDQALILPLVLRRRSPSGVFAFLAAVALIQWLAGERLPSDLSLLIALYTVAAHQPRRRALLAAAVLEIGVVLAAARFAPAGGVLGSLIFLSGLVATALFSGMTLRTRRAYLAFVVDRALRLERERDQQARLAATAERTRIAREMHDIVAHSLSVMVTLADGAAAAHATDPHQSVSAMRDVSATGRQALTEMRRLLGVLRDDDDTAADAQLAPPPGLPQLDELVSQVRGTGLPVQLTMTGQPAAMPPAQQTVVYRVVQEALTNAIKHGRDVSEVRVSLRWTDGRVEVTVTDDGAPCAEGAASQSPGHGLTGMRERVSLYGGQVDAGPRSVGGWRVHAQLGVDRAVDR